jgi:hypothetical protein
MIVPEEAVDVLSVTPKQDESKQEKDFGIFRFFSFKSSNKSSRKLTPIPEVCHERESTEDTQPHLETECMFKISFFLYFSTHNRL